MSQCIEAVSSLSAHSTQAMKRLFWDKTTLTPSLDSWFTRLSPTFLRYREQIRVLSVFSCNPQVDINIINTLKKSLSRFRYVVVEPSDSKLFDRSLAICRQSSLHSIEVSPYPHFFTYETLERFDLILVFGMPLNRNAAEVVVRKAKLLLRPGGQALLFNPADNDLGELTRLLYSAADDTQKEQSASQYSSQEGILVTPGKDDDDDLSPVCDEAIHCLSEDNRHMSSICSDTIPDKQSVVESEDRDYQLEILPCDDDYLRVLLSDLQFTFNVSTLRCTVDISDCLKKTSEGLCILSGLMKIDLVSAMDSLINKINEFIQVRIIEGTTSIPYNYTIFTIFSDVIAESIHRVPDTTATPWFPEGERGPFINVGYEHWIKNINDWRSEGASEPIHKMKISSINRVVETISDDTIADGELPEPINLDELLPLCLEVWKCNSN